MATFKKINIEEEYVVADNALGGTPGGSSTCMAIANITGTISKVGVAFSQSVASTASLAVRLFNASGSTAVMASTAVSTAVLTAFTPATFTLATPVSISDGDCIQFTTSGGPTSAASSTAFAVIVPLPIYST